jgi:hypothetical protein
MVPMNTNSKLNLLRETISPRCNEVSFHLTQTPLDQIASPLRQFIRMHLFLCRPCRFSRRQLLFLDQAFSDYSAHVEELSAQRLSDSARERIRLQLTAADD